MNHLVESAVAERGNMQAETSKWTWHTGNATNVVHVEVYTLVS
jgi:hypothetical protein